MLLLMNSAQAWDCVVYLMLSAPAAAGVWPLEGRAGCRQCL